jgi:hypothetical protein
VRELSGTRRPGRLTPFALPHRFPFRWQDGEAAGRGFLRSSAGSYWSRGEAGLALPLLIEATAQVAARALAGEVASDARLRLAGVERAEILRPLVVGETLEIGVRVVRSLGGVALVEGELFSPPEKEPIGFVRLLVGFAPG